MKASIFALALAALPAAQAAAQDAPASKWYFGLGGAYRSSHMSFSDIDEDLFPENKNRGSGVFSVFALGETAKLPSTSTSVSSEKLLDSVRTSCRVSADRPQEYAEASAAARSVGTAGMREKAVIRGSLEGDER